MKRKIRKFLLKATALTMAFAFTVSMPVFGYSEEAVPTELSENKSDIKDITIYIVGDSTACEYGYDDNYAIPRAGWGMYVKNFVPDSTNVVNLALGGRSSKSFTSEENYTKLKENLKEGDYLLIQFGHNDAKKSTDEDLKTRYTDPAGDINTEGSFKNSLYKNYIKLAEERGATPILISPVSRRKFDEEGKVTDSHGLYDDAVRELAEETGVKLIDMTKETEKMYNIYGPEITKTFHAAYNDKSKGIDNTHFNSFGAAAIASIIVKQANLTTYDDDLFNILTRGEFIEYLMRAIGETEKTSEENFNDIPSDYKYSNSIALAKKAGIANGDEKGNFNSNESLKFYEAVIFINRALKYKGIEYPRTDISSIKYINELSSIPAYALQDCVDFIEFAKQNSNKYMDSPFFKPIFKTLKDTLNTENIDEYKDRLVERLIYSAINENNDIYFLYKDIFLIPVYEIIADNEKQETVEQDLNELEKVEDTK